MEDLLPLYSKLSVYQFKSFYIKKHFGVKTFCEAEKDKVSKQYTVNIDKTVTFCLNSLRMIILKEVGINLNLCEMRDLNNKKGIFLIDARFVSNYFERF